MAIQFPSNPNDGQLFEVGQEVYSWNAAKSRWVSAGYSVSVSSSTAITAAAVSYGPTTSAGFFQLPQGSTAQRPSTTGTGGAYYTTSTGLFSGTSMVHVFTATGTSYFTVTNTLTVAFLLIGGGGGGGGGPAVAVGGGGAGGMVTGTSVLSAGVTYTITVGTGGNGGAGGPGGVGTTSSIVAPGGTNIRALGGGGGAAGSTGLAGGPGGSGGGGAYLASGGSATQPATTQTVILGTYTNYGNAGGPSSSPNNAGGGGGGGAGAVGGTGGSGFAGAGGAGRANSITGSPVTYAGGGGGGGNGFTGGLGGSGVGGQGGSNPSGSNGLPATYYGGGGGGGSTGANPGGYGYPGVVVLSYSAACVPTPPGSTRYNTTLNQIEVSNGTTWVKLISTAAYNIDLLLVGGGGSAFNGFGGGGGGYLAVNIPVTTGTAYTVTIGAGAGTPGSVTGVSSSFTNSATGVVVYTSNGGQGGQPTVGGNSGSTLSPSQTLGYGYLGSPSGGGAGSREPGHGTAGGSGTAWYDGVVYAAGGATSGPAGTTNTGNGGGGLSNAGGSGLVKLRYPGSNQIGSGGTTSTSGGYFYHTFTSSGGYFA